MKDPCSENSITSTQRGDTSTQGAKVESEEKKAEIVAENFEN